MTRHQRRSHRSRGGFVTHRELNGSKRNLSGPAPKDFKPRPFWPLTVNLTIPTASEETYFTNQDVIAAITTQLGLNAGDKDVIVFKIQSVDAWAVPDAASTDRPAVAMEVSSLVPQIEDTTVAPVAIVYPILMNLRDVGNLSQAAKVGYNWPASQAQMPLGNQANHTIVAIAGNVENTTVRMHVMFGFGGESVPPPPLLKR